MWIPHDCHAVLRALTLQEMLVESWSSVRLSRTTLSTKGTSPTETGQFAWEHKAEISTQSKSIKSLIVLWVRCTSAG